MSSKNRCEYLRKNAAKRLEKIILAVNLCLKFGLIKQ